MAKMVEVICVPQTEQESTFVSNNEIKVLPVPWLIADFVEVKGELSVTLRKAGAAAPGKRCPPSRLYGIRRNLGHSRRDLRQKRRQPLPVDGRDHRFRA